MVRARQCNGRRGFTMRLGAKRRRGRLRLQHNLRGQCSCRRRRRSRLKKPTRCGRRRRQTDVRGQCSCRRQRHFRLKKTTRRGRRRPQADLRGQCSCRRHRHSRLKKPPRCGRRRRRRAWSILTGCTASSTKRGTIILSRSTWPLRMVWHRRRRNLRGLRATLASSVTRSALLFVATQNRTSRCRSFPIFMSKWTFGARSTTVTATATASCSVSFVGRLESFSCSPCARRVKRLQGSNGLLPSLRHSAPASKSTCVCGSKARRCQGSRLYHPIVAASSRRRATVACVVPSTNTCKV